MNCSPKGIDKGLAFLGICREFSIILMGNYYQVLQFLTLI